MATIEINGTRTQVPAGAIAWKYADPIEDGRWIYDRTDAESVAAEDPALVLWAPDGFEPTHDLDGEPVMVIDEGAEDGSRGAYTAREFAMSEWPTVRVTGDGRWMVTGSGAPEDITHQVETL